MPDLTGNRIFLREYTSSDLDMVRQWMSDSEVMKFLSWGPTNLPFWRMRSNLIEKTTTHNNSVYSIDAHRNAVHHCEIRNINDKCNFDRP